MPASDDVVTQFRETFRLDELTIQEERGWILSVRPGQITLGSMVLSSSRGHLDFQALAAEDSSGMSGGIAVAERLAKQEFGAARINLACLMMKDPIVHFHVLPRYDRPVDRYGVRWSDADWPGPPTFGKVETTDEVLEAILADLEAAV